MARCASRGLMLPMLKLDNVIPGRKIPGCNYVGKMKGQQQYTALSVPTEYSTAMRWYECACVCAHLHITDWYIRYGTTSAPHYTTVSRIERAKGNQFCVMIYSVIIPTDCDLGPGLQHTWPHMMRAGRTDRLLLSYRARVDSPGRVCKRCCMMRIPVSSLVSSSGYSLWSLESGPNGRVEWPHEMH